MRNPTTRLSLIFIVALVLVFTLMANNRAEAGSEAAPLFRSPLGGGEDRTHDDNDGSDTPSPQSQGLLEPGQLNLHTSLQDPATPALSARFPRGAVSEPVKISFFTAGLPQSIPPLPDTVSIPAHIVPTSSNSPYFFFGVWRRQGPGTVRHFGQSILITVPYAAAGLTPAQENNLRLWRYDPAAGIWLKLGGKVDTFNHQVLGLLSTLTPLHTEGNTLFALGFEDRAWPSQSVDLTGLTTLTSPDHPGLRLHVPPGTVTPGTHFELNTLAIPKVGEGKILLAQPVQVAAYHIDYQDELRSYEVREFSQPLNLVFSQLSQPAKLLVFHQSHWMEAETLGYTVISGQNGLSLSFTRPGVFALVAR